MTAGKNCAALDIPISPGLSRGSMLAQKAPLGQIPPVHGQNQRENPQRGNISPILQNNGGETFYSGCAVLQKVTCSAAPHVSSTARLLRPSVQPPQPSTYPVFVPQS